MTGRYALGFFLVLSATWVGCSHGSDRAPGGTPIGPSATAPPSTGANVQAGGLSHPLDVGFPPRNEAFDFRNQLEAKYRDQLRRSASSTFVDLEGDVVWTQEYLRFRANTCDHATSVLKVFSEIDGGGLPAVCGSTGTSFPPRTDSLDFRRQLETKYQTGLRRPATSTFVDLEGDIVWTQEYLRYRVSTCDHVTAVQKVFSQIDGGGVAADCTPPPPQCAYALSSTSQGVASGGGGFSVTISRTSGSCSWTATADASFITLTGTSSGSDSATVTYSVAANTTTAARSGTIAFVFSGGSLRLVVNQDAAPPQTVFASFRMFDPAQQGAATTACQFRSLTGTPTTCRLDGSTSFTSGRNTIVSYTWTVSYTYVTLKTLTQTSFSPLFSFSDVCGQISSTDDGVAQPLTVQLTAVDNVGNSTTVTSGAGGQPGLTVRLFTCGL